MDEIEAAPEPTPIEVVCGVCNGPLINLGPKYKHANRIDNLHGAPVPVEVGHTVVAREEG